jgi:hypothetical protein
MSRLLSVLLLSALLVLCLGFVREWFTQSTNKQPFSEKRDIHLQLDPEKLKTDVDTVEGKTKVFFSMENETSK